MNAPLPAATELGRRHRLQWWEALPWAAGLAAFFLFPNYLAFGTQVLVTILFALSLGLVLGYAGIVTLGHAAFFGAGAYTVACSPRTGAGPSRCRASSPRRWWRAPWAW